MQIALGDAILSLSYICLPFLLGVAQASWKGTSWTDLILEYYKRAKHSWE